MVSQNQTRFNQSIFVNGDIEISGNINAPFGNIFVGGAATDSIIKCSAVFEPSLSNQSRTLTNVEFIDKFETGKKIRIYGASDINSDNTIPAITTTLTASVQPPVELGSTNTFYYKIAEFNLNTGEISPASSDTTVTVLFDLDKFGVDQFITLTFEDIPLGKGILLYRRITTLGSWKLVSVLGPKDLENNSYIDYYLFDYTEWGGKTEADNVLPIDIIHFSHTPPTTAKLGWVDTIINTIDIENSKIVIADEVTIDLTSLTVNISHNDTEYLQNLITNADVSGKNNLSLLDKVYVVSGLNLPQNFNLTGTPNSSELKKLPWSGAYFNVYHNNIIFKNSNTIATNTISNIIIDGNMTNQFLVNDMSDDSLNYAINWGIESVNCKIFNSKIHNIVGSGIYATESDNIQIFISELRNSGLTDRYNFKPIDFAESRNVSITSNRIENFSDNIDVSIVYKGIIANNIIQNCGNGIFSYGSRFFISSPNVLMGPADEFLPSPDVLNTSYDSVNIKLPTNSASVDYTSDKHTYQENGENFNLLTSNQAVSSEYGNVQYEVWKLSKNNVGVENLYNKITDISFVNKTIGIDPTNGEFQFVILAADIAKIRTTYSYDTLLAINSNHIGLVYLVYLEEWINDGNINNIGTISTTTILNDTYTINIQNPQYLYLGAKVSISPQHQGFAVSNGNQIGTITSISTASNIATVSIKFSSAISSTGNNESALGYINIINKFEMAKGLIL
jgi:hypothetical protein